MKLDSSLDTSLAPKRYHDSIYFARHTDGAAEPRPREPDAVLLARILRTMVSPDEIRRRLVRPVGPDGKVDVTEGGVS